VSQFIILQKVHSFNTFLILIQDKFLFFIHILDCSKNRQYLHKIVKNFTIFPKSVFPAGTTAAKVLSKTTILSIFSVPENNRLPLAGNPPAWYYIE